MQGLFRMIMRIIVPMVIIISMFSLNVSALSSYIADDSVIKVFFPLQAGFAQVDENGRYSGYTYEYLMKAAQLTGLRFEFVAVQATDENINGGLDKLESGEVQLFGVMNYSEALKEEYEYSMPYGEISNAIAVDEENKELNARTLSTYKNLRVALVEEDTTHNELFDAFCITKGIKYQPIYANSNAECKALVENGDADAFVCKEVAKQADTKIIATFSPTPIYFATTKENTKLINQLNYAMVAIDVADPTFQERLHGKYFSSPSDDCIALTHDDVEYIKTAPPIRVAVPSDRAPIQSYNGKTGEFSGIVIDILKEISKTSGLNFEFTDFQGVEELKQALINGDCEMVAGIPHSYNQGLESKSNYLLSSPILSAPIVRISNINGINKGKSNSNEVIVSSSVVLPDGNGKEIKYEEDTSRILEMIDRGDYKEAYVNGYIAQHAIENKFYGNLAISFTSYGNYEICLGVNRSVDLRLISIINQAISALPTSEINDIVYRNTSHPRFDDIWTVLQRNLVQAAVPVVLVLLAVLCVMLAWVFKACRANKRISLEKNEYKVIAQTDRLSETYNNGAFKQHTNKYISQEEPAPYGALLICDIDDFKMINDRLGHLKGDETINKIGALLSTIFHDNDIIGRLGGDEFAVLMKDVARKETIQKRCEELLLKSHFVLDGAVISLSIGVALFNGCIEFDELFKKADAALYEVKSSGKNAYRINDYSNL